MPFVAQQQEKCEVCSRTVFATEKITVEETGQKKIMHKNCLRCSVCNINLTLGTYSALQGKFFCKPHFKQLFATKGNYEEGFGQEKHANKWEASSVVTAPVVSFIPKEESRPAEKAQTSESTVAKFKKFREEGDTNKCESCNKTVYQAEKLLVEDKSGKRLFHKNCFKCSTCDMTVDLRNYGSEGGKIYCKNHLKEATANALREKGASAPVAQTTPTSFIPETTENTKVVNTSSESTVAKFKKFREEGDTNKCESCDKTVYQAERLLVEDKSGKRLFHKNCFKCSTCDMTVDLRNYGSEGGKIYCKNHLKEATANALREKGVGTGSGTTGPKSFVPESTEERKQSKGETPDHIASKFKAVGGEKCNSCGKNVYATEKITVEDIKGNTIYHKSCLKCSVCNIQLDLSTFGSAAGVIYCKVHLKAAAPEMAKVAFDPDAPLTGLKRVENVRRADSTPVNRSSEDGEGSRGGSFADSRDLAERHSQLSEDTTDSAPATPKPERKVEVEREPEPEPEPQVEEKSNSVPETRHNEASGEDTHFAKPALEETEKPVERPSVSKEDEEDAERQRRLEERRREREEKKRQAEEQEQKDEEERQKAREERRKRLEAARNED